MEDKIKKIRKILEDDLSNIKELNNLLGLKAKYFGKKGLITELTSNMKDYLLMSAKKLVE